MGDKNNENILSIRGMSKSFGRNRVLDHINLDVKKGTVMGLMGENGAGKSTMMKCLFGTYQKDEGTIYLDGKEVSFSGPKDALENGASEIDMVINIGLLKEKQYDLLCEEIQKIHQACKGHILKVIIETALLTEEEKIKMCEIVTKSGAEYIKTSTGFSTAGATFEDIALMKKHVGAGVKIKAAGGISSFADAEKFIELGADRLGTSRLVKIAKAEKIEDNSY